MKVQVSLVIFLFGACTTLGQIPLQYEREHGFPFSSVDPTSKIKSGILNSFSKARLPVDNVIPIHYDLTITPILDDGVPENPEFTAPGTITIRVEPSDAGIKIITLNSVGLNITSVKVTPVDDTTEVGIDKFYHETEKEFFTIELDNELEQTREYNIYIVFVAPVERDPSKLNGLYLSTYYKPDGSPSNIATTQMEATAARQAFPCFDEPSLKATFKISVGHHSNYSAYGNTEMIGEPVRHPDTVFAEAGYMMSHFNDTVQMSTYLIAMIVAEFSCFTENSAEFGKPTGVCGPPHLIDDKDGGRYSAEKTADILKYFEDRYEIKYPLAKMDSMAVSNFEFGAMENWGLNIYREPLLLYYAQESTETERQRISIILAHELAHQWFGNLVTAGFWNLIWLNEGFATYNEFLATHAIAPEFEPLSIRQNDAFQEAMIYDATAASHPLKNNANGNYTNAQFMGSIFDRITYEKGGSLIRMMEGFLGAETFRKGLVKYLDAMKYKGADQDDLFRELTTQAHEEGTLPDEKSVKDIMDTWALQSGYPLVRVSKASESMIYISQERFTPDVKYTDNSGLDPNELWDIPVAVATSANNDFSNHTPALWIEKNIALKKASFDTTKWLLVNTDSVAFFRVLYDLPLYELLEAQLEADHSVISEMSRSQLIDDYFTFAAHKFSEIEYALQLTKYLTKERKIVVWNTVFRHLRPMYNKFLGTATYGDFKNYMLPRLEAVLEDLEWEQGSSHNGSNVILRTQMLDWTCALEHTKCREYASRLFNEWTSLPEPATNPIPVDIRQILYCGAVAHDANSFVKAMDKYKLDTTSDKDKPMLLNAVACSVDLTNLLQLQSFILAEPSQQLTSNADKIKTLQNLAANTLSRERVIGYVRERHAELIEKLGSGSIVSFIQTLSTFVSSQSHLDAVNDIISKTDANMTEPQKATLGSYVTTIKNNMKWMEDYGERIQTWLSANV